MDPSRFDSLTRSLAAPRTRRGLLGGLVALAVGARAASAQSSCPPGQTRNRKGDCSCPPGTDACPDGCFDLKRDLANCGRCGRTCLGGECRKGECRCPLGTVLCDGVCRSPSSFANDPDNCGGCRISCDDSSACTTDTCEGGGCVHRPITCDDGNPCTDDNCDPSVGCVHADNADACTTTEGADGICAAGGCVTTTTTTTSMPVPTEVVSGITFNMCGDSIDHPLQRLCLNAGCGCAGGVIGAENNVCVTSTDPYTSCETHDDCPDGAVCGGAIVFHCSIPCS